MSRYKYSDDEKDMNKILKMNQNESYDLLNDKDISSNQEKADKNIEDSIELLKSLGKNDDLKELEFKIENTENNIKEKPKIQKWEEILKEANQYTPGVVTIENIMSEEEIQESIRELENINKQFSSKTNIINKTDLSFLAIATALQVSKTLIFPHISKSFNYGEKADKSNRLDHDDKSIGILEKERKDMFKEESLKKYETGYWMNLLYQTPAYDITRGSKDAGIYMGGAYHRMYTLGHDPILGWIFGTMNILTDIVTLNNFKSYRIRRDPMRITSNMVPMGLMFKESYELTNANFLNLPAAIFAQAQHFNSDKYTKLGLPIPILSTIDEEFASNLYKSNYDALSFSRDLKITGASFAISKFFDIIISLVHGLFRKEDESKDMYEVRTRKILLISNSIASTSTIINASITSNPKNLDIGGLLNTVTRLFGDLRFITRIKEEFINNEISNRLDKEIEAIDSLELEINR